MAKQKLRKMGSTLNKISKNISVEDVNGNKSILKATVISVRNNTIRKDISQEIVEEDLLRTGVSQKIVRPPLSQKALAILSDNSSDLGLVIESMAIGIEAFGGRLKRREKIDESLHEDISGKPTPLSSEAKEEKSWLDAFFKFPNHSQSFVELRRQTRQDLESTGNAYWELIRNKTKRERYSCINKLDVGSMWITIPDKKFTKVTVKYVDAFLNLRNKSFSVKLRKYVQIVSTKSVFFKEFMDPRVIDRRNGNIIAESEEAFKSLSPKVKKDHPQKFWANEVYHFKIPTTERTPYGKPRFTGNIIAIKGSRGAEETNILTQQNNHVPSMVIVASGGQLTEGSVQRIQEFVDTQIKSDSNYSKFLIIEGESTHDSLSGVGNMKVDIKPLTDNQHKDQLWQDYDKNNAEKIRRSFRTPPIMVGKTEDLNRATAQESERLAEKYVYNPERESMDVVINRIMMQQGFIHWWFKSNSPNVTNDQDIVKILTGAEKSGALTPRISRLLLEDVLNQELPPIKEDDPDFDPDLPFSLSLARLQSGAGAANQEGSLATQGQNPKEKLPNGRPSKENDDEDSVDKLHNEIFRKLDPHRVLDSLFSDPEGTLDSLKHIRDTVEDDLDTESFGEPNRDYFDHES